MSVRYSEDEKDVVYRERANGRWEYFVYADRRRFDVTESWVRQMEYNGTARVVDF